MTTDKTSLGDRMKEYEFAYNLRLPIRMPIIIRIDGKAFHTYTRNLNKPFDSELVTSMAAVTDLLVRQIDGCVAGYTQSDEISLLIHYHKTFNSEPWFDNEIQKLVSVSASLTTGMFNSLMFPKMQKLAFFDARCFVIPEEDVVNYFIWRQRDFQKNSIQMVARSAFSHRELQGLNGEQMKEKLAQAGIDYDGDFPGILKLGYFSSQEDRGPLEFSKNRQVFETLLDRQR